MNKHGIHNYAEVLKNDDVAPVTAPLEGYYAAAELLIRGNQALAVVLTDEKPRLTGPVNNNMCLADFDRSIRANLSWNHGDRGPRKFQVVLERDEGCTDMTDVEANNVENWDRTSSTCRVGNTDVPVINANRLAPNWDYTWKVREYVEAENGDISYGPFSAERSFKTRPTNQSGEAMLVTAGISGPGQNTVEAIEFNSNSEGLKFKWRPVNQLRCEPISYSIELQKGTFHPGQGTLFSKVYERDFDRACRMFNGQCTQNVSVEDICLGRLGQNGCDARGTGLAAATYQVFIRQSYSRFSIRGEEQFRARNTEEE